MEQDLVGKTLSHYRVLSFKGKGGMKRVYRGFDERLRRYVAIKVLLGIAADENSRRQIRDEALVLSQLNHPNIETVFDLDSQDGTDFIVAEFIHGKTLSDEIGGAPLPEREILKVGAQIADALASAHGKRIVHRDMKPANVMITPERHVKVLDFGIAKLLGTSGPDDKTKTAKTGSVPLPLEAYTDPKGTLPYMAPEVLEEGRVDLRTDIYSLGVVLFEMATGRRPFQKRSREMLARDICQAAPPRPSQLNPKLSHRFEDVILKCLEKRPERRYQSAIELKVDLVRAESQLGPDDDGVLPRWLQRTRAWFRRHPYVAPVTAGLAICAAAAFIIPRLIQHDYVWLPHQLTHVGNASSPAISPDGKYFAYVEADADRQRVMVRNITAGDPREVFSAFVCRSLRWSQDGTQLLCFATLAQKDPFYAYSIPWPGGNPRRFDTNGWFGAWSPDGKQFVSIARSEKVFEITNTFTGNRTAHPFRGAFNWIDDVDWSPDGKRIALLTTDESGSQLWTAFPDGSHLTKTFSDSVSLASPRWVDHQDLYYLRAGDDTWDLLSMTIADDGKEHGKKTLYQGLQASTGAAPFLTLSRDGTRLLYTRLLAKKNLWSFESNRKNPRATSSMTPITTGTYTDYQPCYSPDGSMIAFTRDEGAQSNIFLLPSAGGVPRQLTFMNAWSSSPVWSADGTQIAFCSNFGGSFRLFHIPAQGGTAQPWLGTQPGDARSNDLAWAPGDAILYPDRQNRHYLFFNPRTAHQSQLIPGNTAGSMFSPKYSNDGKTVAVLWNDWPKTAVWTISPGDEAPSLLYPNGPAFPVTWSVDGRWLYLLDVRSQPERIIRVETRTKQVEESLVFRTGQLVVQAVMDPRRGQVVGVLASTESDVWLMSRGGYP